MSAKRKAPLRLDVQLHFEKGQLKRILLEKADRFSLRFIGTSKQKSVAEWFDAYLEGSYLPFPLSLKIDEEAFTQAVLKHLFSIPLGKIQTYGEIATLLGNPKAARAVGRACGINPYPLVIPCHRVIRSSGGLGGFAFGCDIKQQLLEFEAKVRHN